MARRRTKTSSSSRKTSSASRKSGTSKRAGVGRKTASSRKTTAAGKTSSARKSSAASRKRTGAKKKTASSRKTSSTSRKKTTTARKKTTTARKKTTTARKKTATARKKTTTARRKTATARRSQPARKPLELGSLRDVFEEELGDLYSAEQQLVEALPKVARAATKPQLRQALEHHLEETRGHVRRLEEIFRRLGMSRPNEHCDGMEGLIEEGEEIVNARGDAAAKDAALIGAAQRVEHYEIAAYGTARTLAGELGLGEARDLLDETLDEESNADKLLTRIATGGMFGTGVNEQAAS